MMRKDKPGKPGPAPVLKVVKPSVQDAAPAVSQPEGIFGDKRSGRDRREDAAPVVDPRRQNPERRRSKPPVAWWLERDYVETHHFVQKAAADRDLLDDDTAKS